MDRQLYGPAPIRVLTSFVGLYIAQRQAILTDRSKLTQMDPLDAMSHARSAVTQSWTLGAINLRRLLVDC